jgi:hypothetical protein
MIRGFLLATALGAAGCATTAVVRPIKDGVRARVTVEQRGSRARCLVLARGKARARAARRAQRAFAKRFAGVTPRLNVRIIRTRRGARKCVATAVATARK